MEAGCRLTNLVYSKGSAYEQRVGEELRKISSHPVGSYFHDVVGHVSCPKQLIFVLHRK